MLSHTRYDRRIAYANSKLANIIFSRELATRLSPSRATSNAVDPGLVATGFARNNGYLPWLKHLLAHGLRGELVSSCRGADTILHLAVSDHLAGVTGRYFKCREEVTPSPLAQDPGLGRKLWQLSLELTGMSAEPVSV